MSLLVSTRPLPLGNECPRLLVVSGSRDWVVPSGPEAITPLLLRPVPPVVGHRLVLAEGGDHFHPRLPLREAGGGALGGLLLAWVDGALCRWCRRRSRTARPIPPFPANGLGNTSRRSSMWTERLQAVRDRRSYPCGCGLAGG